MISSPLFLKARAIAFSIIMLTSLLWIVLLSVYVFLEWDNSDATEHPIIAVMLLADTLTIIMLLVLLILPFREWLDAARLLLLMLAHTGVAGVFSFWNPKFRCQWPISTPDSVGVCRLLNLYILVASWVIPVLLIIYASGLAIAIVRSRRNTFPAMDRESILPIMRPRFDGNSRVLSYSHPTEKVHGSPEEQRKHISSLSGRTSSSLTKLPPAFFM
ncbi:hypothetical protein C8F04DRAFT_1061288 [Mycena alexandri]|uniref:Uncharacterized protein n=1 Tax=Mycena alexandri TaxID=1745969 RepID=A0AAD6TIC2_9AGAR|nr:hypothetical protein C8F04DRAFT_1061288 [Mycena alexandri]